MERSGNACAGLDGRTRSSADAGLPTR